MNEWRKGEYFKSLMLQHGMSKNQRQNGKRDANWRKRMFAIYVQEVEQRVKRFCKI